MGAVRLNHERHYFHPSEFPAVAAAAVFNRGEAQRTICLIICMIFFEARCLSLCAACHLSCRVVVYNQRWHDYIKINRRKQV